MAKQAKPLIRVFLADCEVPLGWARIEEREELLDASNFSTMQILTVCRLEGTFSVRLSGFTRRKRRESGREWQRKLGGLACLYWPAEAAFALVRPLGSSAPTGWKQPSLLCHFRSEGVWHTLPGHLTSYLRELAAFELQLPDSLPGYHDWCEEHGWQERLDQLAGQWQAGVGRASR